MAWERAAVRARDKLEMPPGITPYMDLKPKLVGVPEHERYPVLLNICYYAFLKAESIGKAARASNGRPRWFCDLSQGPDRAHWGSTPPGLIQNTAVYAFEFDLTFLEGWGHRMLGFPRVDSTGLSKMAIESLCGESVDLPSQATVLYAIYLTPTAPWWQPSQPSAVDASVSDANVPLPPLKRRRLPASFVQNID